LGGVEIARRQMMHQGRVPLHTLRADIDYGFSEARTTLGRIGIKVWIYRGDILPELEESVEEAALDIATKVTTEVKAAKPEVAVVKEEVKEEKPAKKAITAKAKKQVAVVKEEVKEEKPAKKAITAKAKKQVAVVKGKKTNATTETG
jgi:small subunit ribosomal protein S3